MIYYIVAICIWALLIWLATKLDQGAKTIVGLALMVGAIYALAQLLKM